MAETLHTVEIAHPQTRWIKDGRPIVFELPHIPRPRRIVGGLFCVGAAILFAYWCASAFAVIGHVVERISSDLAAPDRSILSVILSTLPPLLVAILALLVMLLVSEHLFRLGWQSVASHPPLEIHAEGLVDRRTLRRPVPWREIADAGRFPYRASKGPLLLKLSDPTAIRPSPTAMLLRLLGQPGRVAIPTAFLNPNGVLVDAVILQMVRNASLGDPHAQDRP